MSLLRIFCRRSIWARSRAERCPPLIRSARLVRLRFASRFSSRAITPLAAFRSPSGSTSPFASRFARIVDWGLQPHPSQFQDAPVHHSHTSPVTGFAKSGWLTKHHLRNEAEPDLLALRLAGSHFEASPYG